MNVYDATEQAYKNGLNKGRQEAIEYTTMKSDGKGVYYDMNGHMMRCFTCNEIIFVRSGERYDFCPKCGRKVKR